MTILLFYIIIIFPWEFYIGKQYIFDLLLSVYSRGMNFFHDMCHMQ